MGGGGGWRGGECVTQQLGGIAASSPNVLLLVNLLVKSLLHNIDNKLPYYCALAEKGIYIQRPSM